MDQSKVWDVVNQQLRMEVVGAGCFHTCKIDGTTGLTSILKARWVAKRYSRSKEIDCTKLFAAMAHKDTIRGFLSPDNYFDLECDQVEIIASFFNDDLEEPVYMDPPQGLNLPSCHVHRPGRSSYRRSTTYSSEDRGLELPTQIHVFTLDSQQTAILFYYLSMWVIGLLTATIDLLLPNSNNNSMLNFMRRFWYCGYLLHFNLHRNQAERKLCNSHEHYLDLFVDQFDLSNCNLSKPTLLAFALSLQLVASLQKQEQRPVPQIVSTILNTSTIPCPDVTTQTRKTWRTSTG
jgi:hypothetical protein